MGASCALRYKLRSGDIVEILTQPGHHPSRDWLQFAKSPRARQKIKHWLNVHQRERAIEIGRKLIEKEARKYRIAMKSLSDAELTRVSSENGLAKPDDLLAAIGYGKFSARSILARLVPAGRRAIVLGPRSARRQPRMTHRADSPAWCGASLAATARPSRSRDTTTCWSIARDVVIRFAAKRLLAMLPAARASPCIPSPAPTWIT